MRTFDPVALAPGIDDVVALLTKCDVPAARSQGSTPVPNIIPITFHGPQEEPNSPRNRSVSDSGATYFWPKISLIVDMFAVTLILMRIRRARPDTPFAVVLGGVPIPSYAPGVLSQRQLGSGSPFFQPTKKQVYAHSLQTRDLGLGLFQKYQLMTPILLLTISISLLVLFPVIWFGLLALTSIEIPLKMGDIVKSDQRT